MICIGTDESDSRTAVEFAEKHDGVFASIGIHPHYAKDNINDIGRLADILCSGNGFAPGSIRVSTPHRARVADVSLNKGNQQDSLLIKNKIVAIGEVGLDYFYTDSPSPEDQISLLKAQIELALKYDLPIIFHVRDAYDDFWSVFDSFKDKKKKIRGVLHCFTDTMENAMKGLERGLYISVNGIFTFTKDESQKQMFASIPLNKLLLETDAPWLTPSPLRGKVKVNEPAFVREIADYVGKVYQVSFEEIADITTANARTLFKI